MSEKSRLYKIIKYIYTDTYLIANNLKWTDKGNTIDKYRKVLRRVKRKTANNNYRGFTNEYIKYIDREQIRIASIPTPPSIPPIPSPNRETPVTYVNGQILYYTPTTEDDLKDKLSIYKERVNAVLTYTNFDFVKYWNDIKLLMKESIGEDEPREFINIFNEDDRKLIDDEINNLQPGDLLSNPLVSLLEMFDVLSYVPYAHNGVGYTEQIAYLYDIQSEYYTAISAVTALYYIKRIIARLYKVNLDTEVKLYISNEVRVKPKFQIQLLQDNMDKQCFFKGIYDTLRYKLSNGAKVKQTINRVKVEYKKFKGGVPLDYDVILNIAKNIKINIRIDNLLGDNLYNCNTKSRHTVHLTNNRINHVDNLTSRQTIELDQIDMYNKSIELIENKESCIIHNYKGTIKIIEADNIYKLESSGHIFSEFFDEFKCVNITTGENPDLDKFLHNAYIVTSSVSTSLADGGNYNEYDHSKNYARFKECGNYIGFPSKIHYFGPVEPDHELLVGIYQGVLTAPTPNPLELLNYKSGTFIMTTPEINMLKELNFTFVPTIGAYTIPKRELDFEFPEDMLDKVDELSGYAYASGRFGSYINNFEKVHYGSHDWCSHLKSQYGDRITAYTFTSEDYIKMVIDDHEFNKTHLLHIASYITAYSRINVIKQLLNMDMSKIVRVNLDGIYTTQKCKSDMLSEHEVFDNFNTMINELEYLHCNKGLSDVAYDTKDTITHDTNSPKFTLNPNWVNKGMRTVCHSEGNYVTFKSIDITFNNSPPEIPLNLSLNAPGGYGKNYWACTRDWVSPLYVCDNYRSTSDNHTKYNIKSMVVQRLGKTTYNKLEKAKLLNEYKLKIINKAIDEQSLLLAKFRNKLYNPTPIDINRLSGLNVHPANIIFDEYTKYHSMLPKIIAHFKYSRFIFIGDVDSYGIPYQLSDFNTDAIYKIDDCHIINFDVDYRTTDPKLINVKHELRALIDISNEGIKCEIDFDKYQSITIDELQEQYKPTDWILCSNRSCNYVSPATRTRCSSYNCSHDPYLYKKDIQYYTNMFSYEKYMYTKTIDGHYSGDIVFEKPKCPSTYYEARHAFTVHSVQGMTITDNIYIDIRGITRKQDLNMFYTAVSRAVNYEQIYLIR